MTGFRKTIVRIVCNNEDVINSLLVLPVGVLQYFKNGVISYKNSLLKIKVEKKKKGGGDTNTLSLLFKLYPEHPVLCVLTFQTVCSCGTIILHIFAFSICK